METIEEFREAITNLYANMERGIDEEDRELLEYLRNSPDSLQFAIQEIDPKNATNFPVLFESTIIVSNFIRNGWTSFEQNDKEIIIDTLFNFIINSTDTNPAVNKAIICIANIIALETELFEVIFPKFQPQTQIDLIIFLIEEMNDRKENDLQYDTYLTELCPTVLQMLDELPLSIEFLKLSKAALNCFDSYELYLPFMDKFEEALDEPSYFSYCSNFIRTIFISSPIKSNDASIEIIIRIMKFSMQLSYELVDQKIFDTPCEIWCEIVNFSPFLFEDSDFAEFFLTELLKFLSRININTKELQQLIHDVCIVFTNDDFPTYTLELVQIFNIALRIMDFEYSYPLDLSIKDLYLKIPDSVAEILLDQMQDPSPGLFLAACQCRLSEEFLSGLCIQAIRMKDVLPLSHLLIFISKVGIKNPEFKEQWLNILFECFPVQPLMSINCIIALLEKYSDLIPFISQEFLSDFISCLDLYGNNLTSTDIWIKGIQLFYISISGLPAPLLEKLNDFILMFAQEAIQNDDLERYFEFIKKVNKAFGDDPDIKEFKKILFSNVCDLLCQTLSLQPEELQENQNAMLFLRTFASKLKENLAFLME